MLRPATLVDGRCLEEPSCKEDANEQRDRGAVVGPAHFSEHRPARIRVGRLRRVEEELGHLHLVLTHLGMRWSAELDNDAKG